MDTKKQATDHVDDLRLFGRGIGLVPVAIES